MPVARVPLDSLMASDSPRCSGEDLEHVRTLAEAEEALPPIVVHRATMRVVDGMHRLRAAMLRGDESIEIRFYDGDEASSFVLAVSENIRHGLPLSLADRKSAVVRIVNSYPLWSDRMIGSVTGLSAKTVAKLRQNLTAEIHGQPPASTVGRDGRIRPRDRELRRDLARRLMIADPAASLRTIARQAGISPETARVVRNQLVHGGNRAWPAADDGPTQSAAQRGQQASRLPAPPVGVPHIDSGGSLAIQALRADPAFRSTDSGRSLLRMLAAYEVLGQHSGQLIDNVPAHCLDRVERAARACSAEWQTFADSITTRNRDIPARDRNR
jgi:ParB-like chromosome segregation protein Spo0J